MIILSIFKFLLVILGLGALLLLVVGTPIGIVLLLIYAFDKKKRSSKFGKWIIVLFSGLPIFIVIFIAWVIINFVATLFGVNTIGGLTEKDWMMIPN